MSQKTALARLRILIVDDHLITLKFVKTCLMKSAEDYEIITSTDGVAALDLIKEQPPDILITDWMMPNLSGPELCGKVRALPMDSYVFIILLTAKNNPDDILTGLSVGADDYIVKPFNQQELAARVLAGARMVRIHKDLSQANKDLRSALNQIDTLKSLLPICLDCKKVRTDEGYWKKIEDFVNKLNNVEINMGLCPECMQKRLNNLQGLQYED